jgi:hypothetical protein
VIQGERSPPWEVPSAHAIPQQEPGGDLRCVIDIVDGLESRLDGVPEMRGRHVIDDLVDAKTRARGNLAATVRILKASGSACLCLAPRCDLSLKGRVTPASYVAGE